MFVMIRLFFRLLVGMTAVSQAFPPAARAGPAAAEPELPSRPERHAPVTGPEPGMPLRRRQPEPPPPESMPGPMTRERQRLFDGLRSDGIALYQEGRYPEAADRFRRALAIKPSDDVTRRWLRAAEHNAR